MRKGPEIFLMAGTCRLFLTENPIKRMNFKEISGININLIIEIQEEMPFGGGIE
jgi:hypothetical protein